MSLKKVECKLQQLQQIRSNKLSSIVFILQGKESPSYEYNSANHLWISKEKKVRECMLNLFDSELEETDFRADPKLALDRINDWVSNATKGHIKDLIQEDSITADTDLVLANAVYFKGLWTSRFDKANSKRDIFYGTKNNFVTFMRQKGTFNHGKILHLFLLFRPIIYTE